MTMFAVLWILVGTALAGDADKRWVRELFVVVLDHKTADPVGDAKIRFEIEGEEQRSVNEVTGAMSVRELATRDGIEVVLVTEMVVAFDISAPGYETGRVTHTMQKKKRDNAVLVRLEKKP